MQATFNSDFFVTAATIIPVLYLALTLQGSTFDQILIWWGKLPTKGSRTPNRINIHIYVVFQVIGLVIPLFVGSLAGEIISVQDLYNRKSHTGRVIQNLGYCQRTAAFRNCVESWRHTVPGNRQRLLRTIERRFPTPNLLRRRSRCDSIVCQDWTLSNLTSWNIA